MHANVVRAVVATSALLLLSDCNGGGIGKLMPTAAPPVAHSGPASAGAVASAAPARTAPAGHAAQGAAMPQQTSGATTPEQINADCWMTAEADKKLRDLDQRLKFVDRCVDERTKGK